ncbi:MAG: hypothetical protein A2Y97_00130 [Nitrospirae bacterium RBG_13_39_12]|nr:MAG: hypothetical protein A2Y97_00130 [Nitrospirae bacterium RBG_13_39_12]
MAGVRLMEVPKILALAGFACAKVRYTIIIPENTLLNIPPGFISSKLLTDSFNQRPFNYYDANQEIIFRDISL